MTWSNWSDDEREKLVTALQEGQTYREISALLGRSRSSIGGRVNRDAELRAMAPDRHVRPAPPPKHTPVHKLSKKEPPTLPMSSKADATTLKTEVTTLPMSSNSKVTTLPMSSPPPGAPRPAPDSLNVPRVELKALQCKWPVHEAPKLIGGHAFCGAPVAFAGAPYCQFHQHIATPAERRTAA